MDNKNLLLGAIAAAVSFFLLGWLMYDMLLLDFMRHNPGETGLVGRVDDKLGYQFAGLFFKGLLLTYIMLKTNAASFAGGLFTGALIGFLVTVSMDLTIYGTSIVMSKKAAVADVLAATVIWAATGAFAGAVLAKRK